MSKIVAQYGVIREIMQDLKQIDEEILECLQQLQKQVVSLSSCWKGEDATMYIKKTNEVITLLANDIEQLYTMHSFIENKGNRYGERNEDFQVKNKRIENEEGLDGTLSTTELF